MMHGARSAALRVGGYGLTTLVSGFAVLSSVALLVRGLGSTVWADVAVGQSVGTLGAVVTAWGWAVTGVATTRIASSDVAARLLITSTGARLIVATVVIPISSVGAVVVAPTHSLAAGLTGGAFALSGAASPWWFIGREDPAALLVRDTLPRQCGILAGAVAAVVFGSANWYGVGVGLGTTFALIRTVRGVRTYSTKVPRMKILLWNLATQRNAAYTAVVSSAYLNSPVIIVSILAPRDVALFALAERIYRMANTATNPVTQVLQGRAPSLVRTSGRSSRLLLEAGLVAAACGLALIVVMPFGLSILGSYPLALSIILAVPFGVALSATSVSQIIGLGGLIALGRVHTVLASAVVGAAVGLPAMTLLAAWSGGLGLSYGFALAEGAVAVIQIFFLFRPPRQHVRGFEIQTGGV